ncbi:MAG: hypothetical protein KF847_17060 [Pirellulales bacterium]|nr:hypothetical protein [Pirellulales bacterium]
MLRMIGMRLASAALVLAAGCAGGDASSGEDASRQGAASAKGDSTKSTDSHSPAQPSPLRDVLATVDFSQFKFPAGATRTEVRPTSASFSMISEGAKQTAQVVADLRAQLAAAGWKEMPASEPAVGDWGCQLFSAKNGTILQTSVGVSGGELNATLLLVGCVDARQLPRPEPRTEQSVLPSMLLFTTKRELKPLREFYARELGSLGWIECQYQEIPGVDLPPEMLERSQSFLNRSSRLTLNYFPSDPADPAGETRVYLQATVVRIELPIIDDAQRVQFADDPAFLYYYCPQDPPELEAFYNDRLAAAGYTLEPAKLESDDKEGESSKVSWLATPTTGDALLVEFLDLGERTVVQIKKK